MTVEFTDEQVEQIVSILKGIRATTNRKLGHASRSHNEAYIIGTCLREQEIVNSLLEVFKQSANDNLRV